MALAEVLDRFQQRHPAAGFPLAVAYKYVDDQGGYLAALMAYYAFLSLFPLLLLLTTALGYLLRGDAQLQQRVLQSALTQIPVLGEQLLRAPQSLPGRKGLTIGVVGSLYGGLGVAHAAQHAMNTVWGVPRNNRPNPLFLRARGLLLLGTVGLGLLATTVLSGYCRNAAARLGTPGPLAQVLVSLLDVGANAGLVVVGFRVATARRLAFTQVLPGAVGAAVALLALQLVGGTYVRHVVSGADSVGGVFAVVLGLLAYLYVVSVMVVLCAEVNAVRVLELHPRALLTPFTDDVELTEGDEQAYARAAKAQRSKGFETVDVSFDPDASDDKDRDRPQ